MVNNAETRKITTPVEAAWWAWFDGGKVGKEPLRPATIMHHFQKKAALHQLYNFFSMLWLGMSLGKTVITLSTIEHRMRAGQVKKTLIFGPVRVIHAVWEQEARKWEHTKHLRFSVVHGDEDKRLRQLFTDADIYLINYENMAWLSNQLQHYYIQNGKPLPFEMVVYDEISRCKNSTSQRIGGGKRKVSDEYVEMLPSANGLTYEQYEEAGWTYGQMVENYICVNHPETFIHFLGWAEMIKHFQYRTGLTGTPASNGYVDLHGQYLCVDDGKRLGKKVTHFREAYLTNSFTGWGYEPHPIGKNAIERKIADITLEMATEDYLELPETIINDIWVEMPPRVRAKYEEVENELFTVLDCGTEIELFNRASVSNKCLQFCNGSPYKAPESPEWTPLHDAKLVALDSVIEEAAGQGVAVSYLFRSDAERIMKRYKKFRPVNITDTPASQLSKVIADWLAGKIGLLVGHAASMGHGVDGLQGYGDILVEFGNNWSLELMLQMRARFMRQGRERPLTVHRIMVPNTMDVAVADALDRKEGDERNLKAAINRYRRSKGK